MPNDSSFFEKLNPSTGELIQRYPITETAEIAVAVESAQAAQHQWQQVPLKARSNILLDVVKRLYANADALATIVSREVGKPVTDALEADIGAALGIIRYLAKTGVKTLRPKRIPPDSLSLSLMRSHQETWHPRGIIAVIAPWNYPVAISAGGLAAALMAGNGIMFKPSEHSPETGIQLAAIFREALKAAGQSPDLLQIVLGDGSTGKALVESDIQGVIFTGSAAVGQQIRKIAGEQQLWTSLELGGNDAMLILDDTDLDWATSCAIWGRFVNAGQACAAVKRLFVPRSKLDTTLEQLKKKAEQLKIGSPDESGCHLGALISERQREQLHSQVQDAMDKGAQVICGGEPLVRKGWFYAPTILTNVPADARVKSEETFGPVLSVYAYDTVEEAINEINRSQYGLTASVLGNPDTARFVADRLNCGTVAINEIGMTNFAMPCAPWGGWKDSGEGASHGTQSLTDLCQRRIVSESLLFRIPFLKKPLWQFSKASPSQVVACTTRSKAVLSLGAGRWFDPTILKALWQNRSNTKI